MYLETRGSTAYYGHHQRPINEAGTSMHRNLMASHKNLRSCSSFVIHMHCISQASGVCGCLGAILAPYSSSWTNMDCQVQIHDIGYVRCCRVLMEPRHQPRRREREREGERKREREGEKEVIVSGRRGNVDGTTQYDLREGSCPSSTKRGKAEIYSVQVSFPNIMPSLADSQSSCCDPFGRDAFTPWLMEFFACDEHVEIVPSVSMPVLHLLAGDVGPFRAQRPVIVPLWLAVSLQARRRCRIVPPDWMSIENLSETRREERKDSEVFQPLPFHYIELAHLLLRDPSFARESFGGSNFLQVSSLVEDIRSIRRSKIKTGLQNLREATPAVKLNNLAAMEVNQIRQFLSGALDTYNMLDKADMNSNEEMIDFRTRNNYVNGSLNETQNETQAMPRQLRR